MNTLLEDPIIIKTTVSFSFPEEQARSLAETVSVDRTNHSVSFNEFLRLMSMQRDVEPDEETLLDMFR